jgi:hypothetical protein
MLVMFVVSPCYAVESLEEITLDLSDAKQMEIHKEEFEQFENNEIREEEFEHKKTLTEKLNDVYKLEISDTSKPTFLLNDVLTKHFEKGPLESIGVWGVWRGALNVSFLDKKTDTRMNYSLLESRIHGEFKNKKTSFVITTRYCPQDEYTFMQNLFSETVLKHKLDKHNTLIIGNNKTKAGQDGGTNIFILPFFSYSQIGRHFGNIRKLGVRLSGDYDLVEYDLGGYSSGTYFTEFFPGAEFCGWVTLKPLGKTDGRYGNLKIGGGLTSGRRHFNYNTVGGYIRYDYKRIGADFEIQNGDGYNGRLGLSSLHARGYYATLYYNLTKKIQLLARYDEFTPDCTNSSHKQREYSAGINYFIKGQGLKLILNYVFCQDSISKDSHKILIGTQVLL